MSTIAALFRLVLAVAVLGLVTAAAAQADHLEPQKRILPADQARARAMLLKRTDVAAAATQRPALNEAHVTCPALDESDLVLTGEATSPEFMLGGVISFQSISNVYRSAAHAQSSWKRGTGAAGSACLKVEFRRLGTKGGLTLESFRSLPFPRVGQRTKVYRATFSGRYQGQTILFYADAVYLMHSRAIAGIFVGSPIVMPRKTVEVRLARTVAGRMAKAMRGA